MLLVCVCRVLSQQLSDHIIIMMSKSNEDTMRTSKTGI